MCGAEQELNTSPQRMETNYVRFTGMIYQLDKGLRIESLCPKCAKIVGQFIIAHREKMNTTNKKTENRVSTMR
jgi:hypothetical protein